MIYVRPLTDDEQTELRRMTCQEIGRVSQRPDDPLVGATPHGPGDCYDLCRQPGDGPLLDSPV